MLKSPPRFMERGVDTCRLIHFPLVASGQLPQLFREWLARLTIRCFSISFNVNFRRLREVFRLGRPLSEDFTGVPTSSRRYLWRCHLDSKMAAPKMTSTKAWGELFDPYCGGGGKWRPFRFRPPSWMTSFPNLEWGHPRWRPEAEGPPFSAAAAMGVEKFSLYYCCCLTTSSHHLNQYSMLQPCIHIVNFGLIYSKIHYGKTMEFWKFKLT